MSNWPILADFGRLADLESILTLRLKKSPSVQSPFEFFIQWPRLNALALMCILSYSRLQLKMGLYLYRYSINYVAGLCNGYTVTLKMKQSKLGSN